MCFLSVRKIPKNSIPGLYIVYLIISKNCPTVLQCGWTILFIQQSLRLLLYVLKAFSMVRFINVSHLNWCVVISSFDFNFHISKGIKNIFMYLSDKDILW